MIDLDFTGLIAGREPGAISVLMASRHRLKMLQSSLNSLRETAADPGSVQICVAYDPDDPDTANLAWDLGAEVVWQAPRRYGYAQGAHYYAALLERAVGEWILPSWGDDGIMLTQGWDDIVRAQPVPSILYTTGGDNNGNNCFPVVHASVFEATRRFPDLPAIDTWYDDVGKLAGIWVNPDPPIVLMQDRFDITGNNRDQVYVEGRSGYRAREYYSQPYTAWRQQDAQMIKQMMTGAKQHG